MTIDTDSPSVFDAGLPTLDYDVAATPALVYPQLLAAQQLAPIALGPFGPEVLSYELARTVLRDGRFQIPPGYILAVQGITSGPLWDKVVNSLLGMEGAEHIRWVFEHTGCAAVMLARGALGNPWLFEQVLDARDAGPAPEEVLKEWAWVIDRAEEHLGPERAARYLKKFHPWYVERLGAPRPVQDALQRADTLDEQRSVIDSLAPLQPA